MFARPITNVLTKIFVREFFRMNTGFFLLIATLAFGFMSEVEHIALAQFFVSSYAASLIPICIWILYALKIMAFNNRQLSTDDMRFVFNVQFLLYRQQLALAAMIFLLQFLPAICYGLFLVLISWQIKALESAIILPLVLTLICSVFSVVLTHNLNNPLRDQKISFLKKFFDEHYIRKTIQFYTEGLFRSDPLTIGGTKLLTGSLMFGVCALYHYDLYDGRLLAMSVTVCGVANALLIYQLVMFEHAHMTWMKNMPIPSWKMFARLIVVMCIIVLPEAIVLVRNYPEHLPIASSFVDLLYLISLASFFLGYFHVRPAPLEYYTRNAFWIFIALIILILFNVPLVLFIIVNFLLGYLLFSRSYYSFEI